MRHIAQQKPMILDIETTSPAHLCLDHVPRGSHHGSRHVLAHQGTLQQTF